MVLEVWNRKDALDSDGVVLCPVVEEGIATQIPRPAGHCDIPELIATAGCAGVEIRIGSVRLKLSHTGYAGRGVQTSIAVIQGCTRIPKIRTIICRAKITVLIQPKEMYRLRGSGLKLRRTSDRPVSDQLVSHATKTGFTPAIRHRVNPRHRPAMSAIERRRSTLTSKVERILRVLTSTCRREHLRSVVDRLR